MRLFIGIELPLNIKQKISSLCSGLREAKWIKKESMHLTLRFLGNTNNLQVRDLDETLNKINEFEFGIEFFGLGCFSSGKKLRSVWIGVAPNQPLICLQKKAELAAVNAGIAREHRKFKPHVTLARLNKSRIDLSHYLHENNRFHTKPFVVNRITLFESHLSDSGSIYSVLKHYPLRSKIE